jgi:voltage-gated sodium channel
MILVLIYYVFAVMASKILGVAFPEWFGSIGASFSTFFQLMTLESWSIYVRFPLLIPRQKNQPCK